MAELLQMSLLFKALLEGDLQEKEPSDIESPNQGVPPFPDDNLNDPAQEPTTPEMDVSDAKQRAEALEIHRSCIVEAPAGSGKTGLLIQRFLKLLAFGGVEQPDEVLAITFTRKADAEMRHRVLAQLTAAHQGRPLSRDAGAFDRSTRQLAEAALARDRALGWHLLDNPRQLNIRTIDSFCAELAGSTPLVAGAGGRYTPTEDPAPLYQTAAERTLLQMGGANAVLTGDLEHLLLHRDAQPGDFVRLLADMLRQREQWGELLPLGTEGLTDEALERDVCPRLTRTLGRLIGQELQVTADVVGADLLGRLASLANALSSCPGYSGNLSPIALCERFPHAPEPIAEYLDHWKCLAKLLLTSEGSWRSGLRRNHLGFEATPAEQGQIRDLISAFQLREQQRPGLRKALQQLSELPDATYPEEQWRVVKALCRTLQHALVELQLVFAERRTCDFSEIALTTKGLMGSETASDVLHTSVGRLRHLLVDEMQDTSASQYELLEALTASWDGATQTLFLVGDPKQSIYEFRQARVERFRRVMEERRFGYLAVQPLRLTANFRSQAALVSDFNSTFHLVFPSPDDASLTQDSADVPFIEAIPTRSSTSAPALVWHIAEQTQGTQDGNGEDPLAVTPEAHAREVRSTIERFLHAWPSQPNGLGLRAPRVAVLARNRAHLAPVIQEFHQDRGGGPLAFRAVDVEALYERPEILDLLALTRALLHPADRVAWLAVLRSPVCGLSLADLLALAGDGKEAEAKATVPYLIQTRAAFLSADGQQLLARAWLILQQAQSDLGRTSFSTHIERTWRSLGGDLPLESHERANARRFLDLLHECEVDAGALSLAVLNRRLRSLYAEPSAPDAPVELMTIHKAKGLEWDLVLVPALHRGSGRNDGRFLNWLEFDTADGHPEFLLAPIQGKGERSSSLSAWLTRRQQQRETAEAKRLLYVACTRAREELHLFGTVKLRTNSSFATPRPDSLLAAAWPAAQLSLDAENEPSRPPAEVIFLPSPASTPAVLSLAASNESTEPDELLDRATPSRLRRLPLGFDPLGRFRQEMSPLLASMPPANLRTAAAFTRPEGSFAARAFGNAVHRFLELLSKRLASGQSVSDLRKELSGWGDRLRATLRSEGLSTAQARSESHRALLAVQSTLEDSEGAWLLSPHKDARNEATLAFTEGGSDNSLRADRTFFAGSTAQEADDETYLWIVDYKTAEPGGHTREHFLAEQKGKYAPQLRAYAEAAIRAGNAPDRLILALYFPLVPTLLYWPFSSVVPHQ